MHIPDGFLDLKTCVAADLLAVGALAVALRGARRSLPPSRVPLLGLAAAFIFAGQMLNFPVAGGTSGHLVGSVLAAVLLGPDAAVIVLTAVLLVQCLVFADGGLLSLGANIFNMAVIGALAGWAIYRPFSGWWEADGAQRCFGGIRELVQHGAGVDLLCGDARRFGHCEMVRRVPGDDGGPHGHRNW